MTTRRLSLSAAIGVAVVVGAVSAGVGVASAGAGARPHGGGLALPNVPAANTKSDGYSPVSRLSAGLTQVAVAQGSTGWRTRPR